MCRLAAYLGPDITLADFLIAPVHGLMEQAWRPREMLHGTLNADGFGIGWHTADDEPAVYTSPMPIWSDTNLPHLGRALQSNLWLANVRSATPGLAVNQANTQPFYDKRWLFMHNGMLQDFVVYLRPLMRSFLSPHVEAGVVGNSDSEYLFAVLRHLLEDSSGLALHASFSALFNLLEEWLRGRQATLNFVLSNGGRLYAVRHAINHPCPSLYYTTDDEIFPGGQIVASERLTDGMYWQPIPEHHLLILNTDAPPELVAL